ncbi:hypothetical protein D3C80_1205170 [compost metagenome]
MQTEQRRTFGGAQRQYAVETSPIGLFLRAIFCQQLRQLFHAGSHHHLPDRNRFTQFTAQLRRQAHRQQRVSTKGKEIIIGKHRFTL